MKAAALLAIIMQLPLLACEAKPRDCDHCVEIRSVGSNDAAPPIVYGGGPVQPFVFAIRGKRIKTLEQFQAAIASLPKGTEVIWDAGCIVWHGLPLPGGPIPFPAIEAMCANHGVKFTHIVSGY